ncbi:MAG: hypothetical protein FRX49_05481 [Trebouxia sp. A1-2]|nr:MAG: hypothetical protein FRX49_05481 [Trebouxia sp. A1-2]
MNLTQLLHAIKDMSSRGPQELVQLLQQLKVSEDSLRSQSQKVLEALPHLDPARESLGCLFFLHIVGNIGMPDHGSHQFLVAATRFLSTCDVEQIRLAPDKFVALCRQVRDHAVALRSPKLAVSPLKDGLQKLAPSPEHVTPIHADFAFSCLQAKHYNAAASVLEQTILDVEPAKTSMKPTDLLLYCYYGGMIHIGRRKYPEALHMFVQGLTAPTFVVNAITIATYKKYALVSLIHSDASPGGSDSQFDLLQFAGSVTALPKFTPSSVSRFIKSEAQSYIDLASAYSSKKQQDLPSAIEKHQARFLEACSCPSSDGNMGLVKLVLAGRTKRAIQKLTQTFLTLSLADIAQQVGLKTATEAESHILRMVGAGEIFAEIDASAGMVRFLEDPEQYTSTSAVQHLNATIQASFALAEKLQSINRQVSLDPAYVSKLYAKDKGDRFPEDPSDFDAEPQSLAYSFQDG